MADYSEFPTTPTAWQEQALRDQWEEVQPLGTEDPPQVQRRRVDLLALVFGSAFVVLALVLMSGVRLATGLFRDGGILWALLIAAGIAVLAGELRKTRRRR